MPPKLTVNRMVVVNGGFWTSSVAKISARDSEMSKEGSVVGARAERSNLFDRVVVFVLDGSKALARVKLLPVAIILHRPQRSRSIRWVVDLLGGRLNKLGKGWARACVEITARNRDVDVQVRYDVGLNEIAEIFCPFGGSDEAVRGRLR